jgi:hypothetical protein
MNYTTLFWVFRMLNFLPPKNKGNANPDIQNFKRSIDLKILRKTKHTICIVHITCNGICVNCCKFGFEHLDIKFINQA